MIVAVTGMVREARILGSAHGKTLIAGSDGAGLARRLDAMLVAKAAGIISFGIAGGLMPDIRPGTVITATKIIAQDGTYPVDEVWADHIARAVIGATQGPLFGSDVLADTPVEKAALFERTGALAVDMESHIAARAAARHGLPFAALRVVSDPPDRRLPHAATVALRPNGKISLLRVLLSVLGAPWQIPSLIAAGHDSRLAFSALLRCHRLLGRGLAFPDLG